MIFQLLVSIGITDNLLCLIRGKLSKLGFFLIFCKETGFFKAFLNLTCTATNFFFLSVGSIKAFLITSTIPTISFPIFE
tara:strand:+ start:381 stop:617 length:237 start_codon:yes stop_codon:yes gene_type:complete